MKSNIKEIEIKKIVLDRELYPRKDWYWKTAYDYSISMKAGSVFPNIVVAESEGKFILIDGKHRLEAYRMNKKKTVEALVLKGLDRKQMFIESVIRNLTHGQRFSAYDKANIILKLENFKMDKLEISKLVNIPFEKMTDFIAKRTMNTLSGERHVLKAPMKHLSGTVPAEEYETVSVQQDKLIGFQLENLVDNVSNLLSNEETVIKPSKKLIKKLTELEILIKKYLRSNT